MRAISLILLAFLVIAAIPVGAGAQEQPDNPFCVYYFSAVGCSHCARVDPVLFGEWLLAYPGLVVIDYELSGHSESAAVLDLFVDAYGLEWGVPTLILGEDLALQGDGDILTKGPGALDEMQGNPEKGLRLNDCAITGLEGYPRIWKGDRVLIREGAGGDETLLSNILESENINTALCGQAFEIVDPVAVQHSGETMEFEHAIRVNGWLVQWNGEDLTVESCGSTSGTDDGSCGVVPICLTIPKIVSLAIVDAVNPCALAVLTLMLIAILTNDPTNRKKVLWAGLAFTAAIFIVYLFYGLLIVSFFQVIQGLASARLTLYTALGIVAIVLGLLQLKDFAGVGEKGLLTTMPRSLRPMATKLIAGITSVPGAFLIGAFVTLFLLPCTIGPYIIAGGILSVYELAETLPYLLIYNAIFVLPMLAITGIIFFGYTRVEDVSGWREDNIRYLHGIAGAIMLLLGIGMVFGLI
jgi:hypothetical protein